MHRVLQGHHGVCRCLPGTPLGESVFDRGPVVWIGAYRRVLVCASIYHGHVNVYRCPMG